MMVQSALAPNTAAAAWATSPMRRAAYCRRPSSRVRMVPSSTTSSGMMLYWSPPWILPMVRTRERAALISRVVMALSLIHI